MPPYLRGEKANGTNSYSTAETAAALDTGTSGRVPANTTLEQMLADYESQILNHFLDAYGTSAEAKAQIAQRLGISLATLYPRLPKHKDTPAS